MNRRLATATSSRTKPARDWLDTAQKARGMASSSNTKPAKPRLVTSSKGVFSTPFPEDTAILPRQSATGLFQQQTTRPEEQHHRQPGRQDRRQGSLHPEGTEAETNHVIDSDDAEGEHK